MSNVNWDFCGQFSADTQDAFPAGPRATFPDDSWIDEVEARRRYRDPKAHLTLLPPVDEALGIRPYYITVGTGQVLSFMVNVQTPPGVPKRTMTWQNKNGRLFLSTISMYEWPPVEKMITRSPLQWRMLLSFGNNEDGTGRMSIVVKGEDEVTRAERTFDPSLLYRPVPEWGHWDELLAEDVPEVPVSNNE